MRLFAEDYFPGRERVYSPPHLLYILNAEQHAIWLTEQLSKWHRQSLDVRDRELQLYETNKELRTLTADEIAQPENRRRIESQAGAERGNGRRLSGLSDSGQELIKQAMRNPEFGVGHLEKMGRDAADSEGHLFQPDADRRRHAPSRLPRLRKSGSEFSD